MVIGYARVSTAEQNTNLQTDALRAAGCTKIYIDKVSGTKTERAQLSKLKENLREGDIICVWRLDRLGRSMKDLIDWINFFSERKVIFKSLTENIDTATVSGKLIFHIFGALAEFERNLIVERTKAGLEAARSRGILGGRKNKLDAVQIKMLRSMHTSKQYSIDFICKQFKISRPTMYSYIA